MEGQTQSAPAAAAANIRGRKASSSDPVKREGILASVVRKNNYAARLWHERWGFYTKKRQFQEEEALKLGFSLDEYREAIRSLSCKPEPRTSPIVVDPSPKPIPPTASQMIGRRASCPLEIYGRIVKTGRDYPTRPPLPPGQVYDPYKQTMMFLGSVTGDPISYKLPPEVNEVTDEMYARTRQLTVTQLNVNSLNRALQTY